MNALSLQRNEPAPVQRGWMFDLDGVLINLRAKKVTDPCLLELLATFITHGDAVTFNTGRSPAQAEEHILRPLAHLIKDTRLLQRTMVVGEKGGAWATYASDDRLHVFYDRRFSVPLLFREMVSDVVQSSDLADLIELEEKTTMVTLALREGVALEAFQQIQPRLVWMLHHCLQAHGLASTWRVEYTGNCVEVEHRCAGKGLGARRILSWFQAQHLGLSHITAFGDSPSDLAMAEELFRHVPVTFIYVGSAELADAVYPFPMTRLYARYERGTREYLSTVLASLHS